MTSNNVLKDHLSMLCISILLFLKGDTNPIWKEGIRPKKASHNTQKDIFNFITLLQTTHTILDLRRKFSICTEYPSEDIDNGTDYWLDPVIVGMKGMKSICITCDQKEIARRIVFKMDNKYFDFLFKELGNRYHVAKHKQLKNGDKLARLTHNTVEILLIAPHQLRTMQLEYVTETASQALHQKILKAQCNQDAKPKKG